MVAIEPHGTFEGVYSFSDLTNGLYSLVTSKPGFRASRRSAVMDCQAGQELVIDLQLRVR